MWHARSSVPPSLRKSDWMPALLPGLAATVAQLWLTRGLVQLPSPLFGGDYMYQCGCIESIRASGNPMASCGVSGALPGYFPLYGTLVAAFSWASRLAVIPSMLVLSALFRGLSAFLVTLVLSRAFGSAAGLALGALWAALNPDLLVKYTEFSGALVAPLYFVALIQFVRSPRARHALWLGLALAAAGYAHAVVFVGGTVIAIAATVIASLARGRSGAMAREIMAGARGLAIVGLCELLALGYWYRPLFVFHGRTSPHYVEWNGGQSLATLAQQWTYARGVLARFVRFEDPAQGALNLLFLAGVIVAFAPAARRRFCAELLVSGLTLAWLFHFFVTMPLLHTHFIPNYVWRLLWSFAVFLVAGIPVALALERIRSGRARLATAGALAAIALTVLALETRSLAASDDIAGARKPLPPQFLAIRQAILQHTGVNDVFLSTNELSFAISALTGRKTVVARRAQNDPFVNMDERNRDAALILYGHDDSLRRELLRRWHVSYLLWTDGWVSSEYSQDESGAVVERDPLLFFYNPEYERQLQRAGVATETRYLWVDPFLRGPEYPRFDLTFVTPANYERPDHPWRPALDSLMREVWKVTAGDQKLAVIYRVTP